MAEASEQAQVADRPLSPTNKDEAKLLEDLKLEEKRKKMDPKHLELFEAIDKGNFDALKRLIEDGVSPNISDEHDMSPLLQASFKGHTKMAEFLISQGADVNMTCHTNFYTPLMMAAISGKIETVKTLLDRGATVSTQNSIGKTATDLAGFVGQHEIASLIRNYLTMDQLEAYYTSQGNNPPRLSKTLASTLQGIVMTTNFHPVSVVIAVNENTELCTIESLKKSANVIDNLCRKCVRDKNDFDEVLALKLHLVSAIFNRCKEQLEKASGKSDMKPFLKILIKGDDGGIKIGCEKMIRQSLMKFPYTDLPLLQYLVKTLSSVKLGEDPTAISCVQTVFNGMQAMRDSDKWCSTCGNRNAEMRCSACKNSRYCSQRCQKLHWFVHKKKCVKNEAE